MCERESEDSINAYSLAKGEKTSGTTGHSQGIITSAVIASSNTEEEFTRNAEKALGLLFWTGTRAQQVFPPTTLNPTILEDSLSNNEGNPTPMLAITGLREDQVLSNLDATNAHLAPDRQIKVTLFNGPRSFVCTGPPQSLYGLNLSLRKLKAPTGLEQSRVPFSQRKLKFSSRFLPITAPFHSNYLESAIDILVQDIQRGNLTFDAKDLAIPVFATDSGNDDGGNQIWAVELCGVCICCKLLGRWVTGALGCRTEIEREREYEWMDIDIFFCVTC